MNLDLPSGKEYSYQVLSSQGRIIDQGEIIRNSSEKAINLKNYSPGIYFVKLIDKAGVSYWIKVLRN